MPSIPTDAAAPDQDQSAAATLNLRTISASCASGTCPTIYDSGRGTIVVQGYLVSADHAGVALPDGEQLVEIPIELLTNAARSIA
jgi:hypothetical protein